MGKRLAIKVSRNRAAMPSSNFRPAPSRLCLVAPANRSALSSS
jgi:hypothetical protein